MSSDKCECGEIANLSELSLCVDWTLLYVAISKRNILVFHIQSHKLLQHKQSQFAIGAKVLHKLKQLAWVVLWYLGQSKDWLPSQEHEFLPHSAAAPTAALRDE